MLGHVQENRWFDLHSKRAFPDPQYKIKKPVFTSTVVQPLLFTSYYLDREAKLNFVNWYLRVVLIGEIDSTVVLFGGEAWFHRTGYVTR
jgi:hypothetical protein